MTTSDALSGWSIETYLGVVTGDVTLHDADGAGALASARRDATEQATLQAISRGAHALTGLQFTTLQVGAQSVLSVTATAVTLRSASDGPLASG